MYKFIFYFFYKSQIKRDDLTPMQAKSVSSIFVAWTFLNHILFIGVLINICLFQFYDSTFKIGKPNYIYFMALGIPISILIVSILNKYFNESRINDLAEKYDKNDRFYTIITIIKFIVIFLLPLFGFFFLGKYTRIHLW